MERLLATGLLERRSDRSLSVTGVSDREAAELLGLRIVIETGALRLSLERLDDAAIRKARHTADESFQSEDAREIEELDIQFHRLIYSRCGNDRMLALIDALRREGRRVYASQPYDTSRRAMFHAEHQAILQACVEKDAERAIHALSEHLRGAAAIPKVGQL
jgi:DNA-binding GntR family transcriptional regulator